MSPHLLSRPDDTAKTLWLTAMIVFPAVAILAAIVALVNHWLSFVAIVVLIAAWFASLPFWVWISASILIGAYWIARAIRNHP